jgi:16S rRNA (cytidine1402-2'-O)-methyltransferase
MNPSPPAGRLTLAATPIGNLADISRRLVECLHHCDLVLAEDTRVSAVLLQHLQIRKPMLSFHDHSNARRLAEIRQLLLEGKQLLYLSDAGTPLIADPGYELVRLCLELGVEPDSLPGPSAPLLALTLSGLPPTPFAFFGFFPQTEAKRRALLATLQAAHMTTLHFESPHRIRHTLQWLASHAGETPLALCRELTKLHQQVLRGSAGQVLERLQEERGEMVLVLGPLCQAVEQASLQRDYQGLRQEGLSHRASIRRLAGLLSRSKQEVEALLAQEAQSSESAPGESDAPEPVRH